MILNGLVKEPGGERQPMRNEFPGRKKKETTTRKDNKKGIKREIGSEIAQRRHGDGPGRVSGKMPPDCGEAVELRFPREFGRENQTRKKGQEKGRATTDEKWNDQKKLTKRQWSTQEKRSLLGFKGRPGAWAIDWCD